jgi:single-strand DNA-binding protein
MSNLNRVMLIGRLGQDPELRITSGGTTVCNLSLATTEKWKDKNGDKQERTEWHRCVAWGKQAEILAQYVSKGSLLYVEGSLETKAWDDKDGNKRYTTEIRVKDFQFLDTKKDGGARGGQHGGGGSADYESQRKTGWAGTTEPASDYGTPNREGLDDDIPF